jgi:hypothetical protein
MSLSDRRPTRPHRNEHVHSGEDRTMSLEPARSPRLATLARLAAAEAVSHHGNPLARSAAMTVLPSTPLARDVAACPDCHARVTPAGVGSLCARHEAVWRFEQAVGVFPEPMAGDVGPLLRDVLSTGDRSRDLLDAFRRQASALNLVWEAHLRGATRLPEEVADLVRTARERAPDFLAGRPVTRSA